MELLHRPRRLRTSEAVREMAREPRLSKKALVYPVFIREGSGIREEIPSLPGQYHYSPDDQDLRGDGAACQSGHQ